MTRQTRRLMLHGKQQSAPGFEAGPVKAGEPVVVFYLLCAVGARAQPLFWVHLWPNPDLSTSIQDGIPSIA